MRRPSLSHMGLPCTSCLSCKATALLTPRMVTRFICMPRSRFSQMGFSSRFENAFLASPPNSLRRASRISFTCSSITLSTLRSLSIGLRCVKIVSYVTVFTLAGTLKVWSSFRYKGFFSKLLRPVNAFFALPPFSPNRLRRASR